MNSVQKTLILSIADKLTMMGYALGQEIDESADVRIVYDIAATLQDIEAELLTIPHKKVT